MSVPEPQAPGTRRVPTVDPRRPDGIEEVAARLRSRIVRAELGPGERLGNESGLAGELHVPVDDVHAAVDRLEQSGLVRRVLGRAGGVLVVDGRRELPLDSIESLPDPGPGSSAGSSGSSAGESVRVLRVGLDLAGPRERRRLGLAEGASVVRVLRVRTVGGRPFSVELIHLPDEPFPNLVEQDLTALRATLRTAYGVTPRAASVTVEVVAADPVQAQQLWVPVGAPLVRVERLSVDDDGTPVTDTLEHVAADRVRYHLSALGPARSLPSQTASAAPDLHP